MFRNEGLSMFGFIKIKGAWSLNQVVQSCGSFIHKPQFPQQVSGYCDFHLQKTMDFEKICFSG